MLNDYSVATTHMVKGALRLLRPHDLVGAEKVRVGRFFDGGYVMVDRFQGVEAAYSLGINDDVSWDLDMAGRGIPIYQYDYTIPGLPQSHPLFHWESIRISGEAEEDPGVATLEQLIERNGHKSARNMILKCDIEGSEWLLLQRTPNNVLRYFSQIVMEIHALGYLSNMEDGNNVRQAFLNLTASHRVVHIHANNFADFDIVGGVPVPQVIEVTLARRDLGEFVVSDQTFPTHLDMPCNTERADLYLGKFDFD